MIDYNPKYKVGDIVLVTDEFFFNKNEYPDWFGSLPKYYCQKMKIDDVMPRYKDLYPARYHFLFKIKTCESLQRFFYPAEYIDIINNKKLSLNQQRNLIEMSLFKW